MTPAWPSLAVFVLFDKNLPVAGGAWIVELTVVVGGCMYYCMYLLYVLLWFLERTRRSLRL